jgi:hypothetical protein
MSQGWSWSRLGYLEQRNWCFALAVLLALRKQASTEARPFLKPHLLVDLGKASRCLARRPELLASLRTGWGTHPTARGIDELCGRGD